MKIRIKSDSVRFRLTRSEVERFAQDGVFKEKVQIGDDALTYVLQSTLEKQLSASFKNNIIAVLMPEEMANEWTGTDKVGFAGDDRGLHILIEKDFTCLDEVDEDQSDNYPNPLAMQRHE